VTRFYAAPDYTPDLYEDSFPIHAMSREKFMEMWKNRANNYLAGIATLAKEAGVEYQGIWATSDYPAEAIIRAAENNKCDLIYMASHGKRACRDFLGSVTQKVLTYCKIPVLVYR
jgi:nucleotide-binding universal stress UspA family protein